MSDKSKPLDEQKLPAQLKKAVIACGGKLTPNFEYIEKMREENEQKSMRTKKKDERTLEFEKTSSVMYDNVKNVQNIEGEALDFSK